MLARKAGMGDGESFTELFSRHFEPTYRFALHMLDGDDDAAADAAQDAWIKAWRKLVDFRGESRFQTWIFTIVSREVLTVRRRRRPLPLDEDTLAAARDTTNPGREDAGDPHQQVLRQELWAALALALTELPWRQKACWLLREVEDLSYDEIARILDTTPTVVRGQLHRARRALALRMEQWR